MHDQVNSRLSAMEAQIASMQKNEEVDHRFTLMEAKLSMLSDRIDNVELQLADMTATSANDSIVDNNR